MAKIIRNSNGKLRLLNGMIALAVASLGGGGSGNASAITIVSLPNQVVIQRLDGARIVPVGGSITGDVGTKVEARVIDSTSKAEVVGWTVIGETGADTNYAGSLLVPEGGMYKLQTRPQGSQALIAETTTIFGVGIVAGCMGQSNMKGFFEGAYQYPLGHKRGFHYNGVSSNRIGNFKDSLPANTLHGQPGYPDPPNGTMRADGPVYLANMLAAEFNVPVMVVETYNPGQSIDVWLNGADNAWTNFKKKLDSVGGDMEVMFWYQGESDAHTATKTSIEARWNQLYALALSATKRTTDTFKMGMILLGPGSYAGAIEGEFGRFRVWQRDFSTNTPGWFFASSAHCSSTSDGVHIWKEGPAYIGRAAPRSYLALKGIGVSGMGPYITSASRNGLQVTFNVAHTGGTALKDGAGGAGAALTGFRFFDAGAGNALIGYTTTNIVGNTITVLLNSAPVGALTADYGIMNAPHGAGNDPKSYVPASAVFDNVVLPNRTVGCIMQPCAAINVN